VYEYTDNKYYYDKYYGDRPDNLRGPRSEFDDHKLIGFTNSLENAETIVAEYKKLFEDSTVIVKYLENGLRDLDRFEQWHLTGADPENYKYINTFNHSDLNDFS